MSDRAYSITPHTKSEAGLTAFVCRGRLDFPNHASQLAGGEILLVADYPY
jgi:hypothetical protein